MMDSDSDQEYMDDLDSDLDADFVLNSQKYEYECEGSHPKDYKILNRNDIIDELNVLSKDTSSVLGLSDSICKALLYHFKWNTETLLERFYEAKDSNVFFRQANLVDPSKSTKIDGKIDFCKICCEKMPLVGLLCNHLFCHDCWSAYLSEKILNEGTSYVTCAAYNCAIVVDDEFINKNVSRNALQRYHKIYLNTFVESNPLLQWCPANECGRAVKVPHSEPRGIQCDCGFMYCFKCLAHWHEPVPCDILMKWLKKCSDDSETSNWVVANTKDCPKCHVVIEKDGGCNHMTCKSAGCRFEFCWVCLGPWGPHGSGWYQCNRFDDDAAKKARDSQERSRASLQRYLHYFNRYINHHNSSKLEKKLYKKVEQKVNQMQQYGFTWIETQFMQTAVDILCACRRTLMYTYVFAYYLLQNNITIIFEDNQNNLELSTEQLSGYLERDLFEEDFEDLMTLKQKVQDKYRYVENRRQILLKHCVEGYEKEQWTFNRELLKEKSTFKK